MAELMGKTCLYKDGESKHFESEDVEAAEEDGWKDSPIPIVEKSEPKAKKTETPVKKSSASGAVTMRRSRE